MSQKQVGKSVYFDALQDIFFYAPNIEEWKILKKELVKYLPLKYRTLFTQRHPISKQMRMNDFEITIAKAWTFLTKKPIRFDDDEIYYKER